MRNIVMSRLMSVYLSVCLSHNSSRQESLANAKVNARQHCVSLSCLYDHFLVWRPISLEPCEYLHNPYIARNYIHRTFNWSTSVTDGQTELRWHIRAIAYMLSRVKTARPVKRWICLRAAWRETCGQHGNTPFPWPTGRTSPEFRSQY